MQNWCCRDLLTLEQRRVIGIASSFSSALCPCLLQKELFASKKLRTCQISFSFIFPRSLSNTLRFFSLKTHLTPRNTIRATRASRYSSLGKKRPCTGLPDSFFCFCTASESLDENSRSEKDPVCLLETGLNSPVENCYSLSMQSTGMQSSKLMFVSIYSFN